MIYQGKVFDGFEYVIRSLIQLDGSSGSDHVLLRNFDCLSFRCFAFQINDDIRKWFAPAARWPFYMERLQFNSGLSRKLRFEPAGSFRQLSETRKNQCFLVGEAPNPSAQASVKKALYSGNPDFYLCKNNQDGRFRVCNPQGSPLSLVERDFLIETICDSNGFVAWLEEGKILEARSPENILQEALKWRRDNPDICLFNQIPGRLKYLKGGVREMTALRYGLINYQMQANKTINYFYKNGLITENDYRMLNNQVMELLCRDNVKALQNASEMDYTLWVKIPEGR